MQLVPLVPPWAKSLAALAVPTLLALATVVPSGFGWLPVTLAFVAAFFTGQALPAPKWAAGKPLVQGPLVPVLASLVPLLVAFAQQLPAGYVQVAVYGVALVLSGLAGLASPEPLTLKPMPAGSNLSTGAPKVELVGCSLADAAQGKCPR